MGRYVNGWFRSCDRLPTVSGWYPASLNCTTGRLRWFDADKKTWSEYAPADGTPNNTCSPEGAAKRAVGVSKWSSTGKLCWQPQPSHWPANARTAEAAEAAKRAEQQA